MLLNQSLIKLSPLNQSLFNLSRLSLLVLCIANSACGEFAYRRGASTADYRTDQTTCRAAANSDGAYELCMQAKGWSVQTLDEWNPVATLTPNLDNRDQSTSPAAQPSAATGKAADKTTGKAVDRSVPPDPMTRFNISSWWKAAAGGDALKAAMQQCTAELGASHAPEEQVVTRAFVLCMRERGWTGLGFRIE